MRSNPAEEIMQHSELVQRFTRYSKVRKFTVLALIALTVTASIAVSFATTSQTSGECGAHVALVLDRSSSIGVDQFSGSAAQSVANISAIKNGAMSFVDAVKGPDSYMDLFAFASVAQRINSVPSWFKLDGSDDGTHQNVDVQKLAIGITPFKTGANSAVMNAYEDGMTAPSEGLTNWEAAMQVVQNNSKNPVPTHLVIFTDGNPTTNTPNTLKAIAAGGSFTAAGLPNEDGVSPEDISRAVTVANQLRAAGTKIIPVAVGAENIVNMANLQALAGAGNPVYRAGDYSQLTAMFQAAAANVCTPPPSPSAAIAVQAIDEQGNLVAVPVNVGTTGTVGGPSSAGDVKTTTTDASAPWGTRWDFTTPGNWRTRVSQTAVPAGYTAIGDHCRRDSWDTADIAQVEGTADNASEAILDPIAAGGTIYCQFVLRKAADGITLDKTVNPTTANRGQSVTYSFVVKNTGNTKLTNVVVSDPMFDANIGTIPSIEAGASSAALTKTYVIPADATGTIHNTATATGTPINTDGSTRPNVTATDTADVIVALRPGSGLQKTVTPSVANAGTEVTYTFTVANTGETTLSNVVVVDQNLNQNVTVAGPIAPGASASVQLKYTLKASDFVNGVFKNTACIQDTQTCASAQVSQPSIALTKTGPATARPGEKVTYSFTAKNTGATDLTNIKINDETLSKYTTAPVIISIPGTLKPGQTSAVVTYDFTIPASFVGNVFTNTAVVHSTPVDLVTNNPVEGVDVTAQASHTINLLRWTTTKVADKRVVTPGQTVTYTITVTNTGGAALTNVEVSDPTIKFPADGKPVAIASIAPGESKTVTATYIVPADSADNSFMNTAVVCVPSTSASKDCKNPTTTIFIARIDIVKTADKESSVPGGTVKYTFVVSNKGGAAIDPEPISDDVLGVIGDPRVLQPGESETFTKDFVVPAGALDQSKIINVATVCAPIPADASPIFASPSDAAIKICADDTHTLLVEIPAITIKKTADKESASEGDSVVYTFVVTNTSKVMLTNITVTDNVLGDVGSIDKLEPGATGTKSVTYVVPVGSATKGTIRNVATACFAQPVFAGNCASADHSLSIVAVEAAVVTRPAEALPFTGAQSGSLASFAAALIAAGIAMFMSSRRRNTI